MKTGMWAKGLVLAVLVGVSSGISAADQPGPRIGVPAPSQEWISVIERLRMQPRALELIHGNLRANIADVYTLTPEQKARTAELMAAYEAEMLKRAAKWEEEMKAVRAEHEKKFLELLPEEKRAQTAKILEYSHAQWSAPFDRTARMQNEMLRRKAEATAGRKLNMDEMKEVRGQLQAWMKEERGRQTQAEMQAIQTIKSMLTLEESARLEQMNPARPAQNPAEQPKPTE